MDFTRQMHIGNIFLTLIVIDEHKKEKKNENRE